MSNSAEPPFQRTELLDKPGIVGAKWWQEGLATHDPVARRAGPARHRRSLGVGARSRVGGLVAGVAVDRRASPTRRRTLSARSTCSASTAGASAPRRAADVRRAVAAAVRQERARPDGDRAFARRRRGSSASRHRRSSSRPSAHADLGPRRRSDAGDAAPRRAPPHLHAGDGHGLSRRKGAWRRSSTAQRPRRRSWSICRARRRSPSPRASPGVRSRASRSRTGRTRAAWSTRT